MCTCPCSKDPGTRSRSAPGGVSPSECSRLRSPLPGSKLHAVSLTNAWHTVGTGVCGAALEQASALFWIANAARVANLRSLAQCVVPRIRARDADRAELRSGAAVGIYPPRPAHTDRHQGRADKHPAALLPACAELRSSDRDASARLILAPRGSACGASRGAPHTRGLLRWRDARSHVPQGVR